MSEKTKKRVQKPKPKTPQEKFERLAQFLAPGKTATQIAASYHLSSIVAAKRLVKYAQKAGFTIEVTKGKKPPGSVGRLPNVYRTAA